MKKVVTITADGKKIEAVEESPLLPALLDAGFDIPTLCHHASVAPYGACRLCLVEVNQKGWDADWWKLTTSCNFPVLDGLTVRTETLSVSAPSPARKKGAQNTKKSIPNEPNFPYWRYRKRGFAQETNPKRTHLHTETNPCQP